ncbi:hypothetical protein H311_03410 [Anncaliia algerae PRA109]|nr:hypothetical protein H311_03410 [Anncaliia algerae PRA109]
MLNYKCKSHRGRSPSNKSDSLCIVEVETKIIGAYFTIIPDKKESTIVPIICSQVASNSRIWTDEHKYYSNLNSFNFVPCLVCYKYELINSLNGVNTQAIESFNNCLKLEIKKRKGIKTENREVFLKEFLFNNRHDLLFALF